MNGDDPRGSMRASDGSRSAASPCRRGLRVARSTSRVLAALTLAGCASALVACAGPPLPTDPAALEVELRARVEMLRTAFPALSAEGTVAIDGPDRVTLNWRADAVRGRWARVAVSSSLANDPVVEVRARVGDDVLVRVSPPGAPAALYRSAGDLSDLPVDDPIRTAAAWLNQLARDDTSAMPSLSSVRLGDERVHVEFTRQADARATSQVGALAVALRRSDGMPVEIDASLPGNSARVCLLARPRGSRSLAVVGTPLSLTAGVDATFQACCNGKALATVRLTIARLRNGAPGPLPRWPEVPRSITALHDNRAMRRAFRDAQAVLGVATRACPPPPGGGDR